MKSASPTLKTIAVKAGVSAMTVSRALRNDPGLRPGTVERIRRIAGEVGYCGDPRLTELSHKLRARRLTSERDTIALLKLSEGVASPLESSRFERVASGVTQGAKVAGCSFEIIPWKLDQITPHRMVGILEARGIRGAVVYHGSAEIRLTAFSGKVACITIGVPLEPIEFDRVGPFLHEAVDVAWDFLWSSGFRRIGLYLSEASDLRTERICSSIFLANQVRAHCFDSDLVHIEKAEATRSLDGWISRTRPDAVMSDLSEVRRLLGTRKRDSGAAFGFARLDLFDPRAEGPGVDLKWDEVGYQAARRLGRHLAHNDLDMPKYPIVSVVSGVWRAVGASSGLPGSASSSRPEMEAALPTRKRPPASSE